MTSTMATPESISENICQAVQRLVSTRRSGETVLVSLPIMYPSGAFAAIGVTLSGENAFVSDSAVGLREAEMAGAFDFFEHSANQAARSFGVSYDGASLFLASASISRVEGAIVAVANASSAAVHQAVLRASMAKEVSRNTHVYDLVSDVFGSRNVSKTEEIRGREATWTAHNIVRVGSRRAIFEYVSSNTNSVASKFLMFSDIMRLEDAPLRNSVVSSLQGMGPKSVMLHDVSNVIAMNADPREFRRFVEAA